VLRLTGSGSGEALSDGPAATVVPVVYESDPGYQEWEVRAVRPGTAVVRAGSGTRQIRITFTVVPDRT
jgi:predicted secreted protein